MRDVSRRTPRIKHGPHSCFKSTILLLLQYNITNNLYFITCDAKFSGSKSYRSQYSGSGGGGGKAAQFRVACNFRMTQEDLRFKRRSPSDTKTPYMFR